jgi:integrase/recombinase XerD
MLQTLLEAGARASELVQLRVEDVSLTERVITIRQGKGGERREVPIRRDLAQVLRLHIGTQRAGPLFASRQEGSRPTPHMLTRQRVGQIVRTVAVAAAINKRVYPHLLRHTVATRLLALGMDITACNASSDTRASPPPVFTPKRQPPRCNAGSTS